MNTICVQAEALSKSFAAPERHIMALRALQSWGNPESTKQELWVLRDLSCIIKKGERLALLGRNGSGKTTFLRILTGIYTASAGTLHVNGIPRVIFNSSIGLNAFISVLDNIYLLGAIHGIEHRVLKKESENILETAGLSPFRHSLLKRLSVGQVQRLALSIFFKSQGDLFVFDEALASVDPEFLKTCDDHFKQLFQKDSTVIMTSHDNVYLKKNCTTALWLEEGKVKMHGPFDEVSRAYEQSFF